MEEWQKEHITQHLPELIEQTTFNSLVKATLEARRVLSNADIKNLDAVQMQKGDFEASRLYYKVLLTRKDAYKVLYEALKETNQSGAFTILIRVPSELFSKPLTYLGISTVLKTFQDVDIEVQGKTFKIKEFFPSVDYGNLQQIFRNCLKELEIYDIFHAKERKFILASSSVPPKPSYYVPRFLSNRVKIHESVFKSNCKDVFVFKKTIARHKLSQIAKPHFTNTSTSQLNKITSRFIYLDEDEDWTELKKLAKIPIHLINYEAGQNSYLLEDSSAPSDILRKLGSREESVYISEDEFVQKQLSEKCTSSSVCICDTPGMGKTFLLANIARLMADKCAGRLVVFIQLTSFAKEFFPDSTYTTLEPKTSLINVLSYICPPRQNPELLLKLAKAKLLQLEIFFDGFDEISADKFEWTKQVFECIRTNYPIVRIYITSRPHMRKNLEQSLGVVAYDLLPFKHQNQVDFLVQFWRKEKPDTDQLSLQSYATNCLKALNESLTKNEKEIAGIPLLCQLIAEVYLDKIAFRSIKTGPIWGVPRNVSGMYQEFIEKKIKLFSKDQMDFDNIKMFHIWHALKLLFSTNCFHQDKEFKSSNDLLNSPKMLNVGILQQHSNGALEFIHRTFAEYLVADYFITKLKEMQKIGDRNFDSTTIFKLILENQLDVYSRDMFVFLFPVIAFFFNSALIIEEISEELKMRAAAFIFSISHEDLICILRLCCQHNLENLFGLLTHSLIKWDNSRILECFTNDNSYALLKVCIEESSSHLFQTCIQLLAEVLKMDMEQISTYVKSNVLLQMAVMRANYEAVEYFVDRSLLENQYLLEKCVEDSYEKDDIEKRVNILHLLLSKDPTLIRQTPHILSTSQIDVRLLKVLLQFGANLTAAGGRGENCATNAACYMSPTDYHELVQLLWTEYKAKDLFLDNLEWKESLPKITERVTLLPETLELLLNIPGIDINMKDKNGENLLFSAVKGGKWDNVQQLFERGLDLNARGENNRNLLHVAAKYAGVEMVRYFLSLKLDPNSQDENEWTPLHYAADGRDRLSVVEVLVENGANVQAKNSKGQTALHIDAKKYYLGKEVIKYLIGKGVGVNDRDKEGNTPLQLCKEKDNRSFLIEMGADRNVKNKWGWQARRKPH